MSSGEVSQTTNNHVVGLSPTSDITEDQTELHTTILDETQLSSKNTTGFVD